jgi:hypothetical protein
MGEKKSYTYYSVYMSSSGYPSGQSNNHLREFLCLYDLTRQGKPILQVSYPFTFSAYELKET